MRPDTDLKISPRIQVGHRRRLRPAPCQHFAQETSKDYILENYGPELMNKVKDSKTKLEIYDLLLAKFPKNHQFIREKGEIEFRDESYEAAEKTFASAIKNGADIAWTRYYLAEAQRMQDKDDKAIDNLNKCLELNNQFHWAFYPLGLIYKDRKERKKAIAYFDSALAEDEIKPYSWEGKLGCQMELKDYQGAVTSLHKLIEFDKTDIGNYRKLANVYYLMDNKEQEILTYQKRLEIHQMRLKANAEDAKLFGHAAWYAIFAGEFEEALDYCETGIKLNESMHFIHSNKVNALICLGRIKDAKNYIDQNIDRKIKEKTFTEILLKDFTRMSDSYLITIPTVEKNIRKIKKYIQK